MGNLTKPDDAVPARLLRGSVPPSPQVPSPQRLFTAIRSTILESQEHKDLIFENIPPETGALVIDSLDEDPDVENSCPRLSYNSFTLTINITIMPTFVYEAHTSWLHREVTGMIRSGFLNESEEDSISFCGKPTFRGFKPPYSASRIEADFAILPDDQTFPSIVFESGWQGSVPQLHHDKDLWLQGGRPQVQLVFLAKWSKDANGVVTGTLEAHGKNGIGSQLLQSEVIFPAPANSATQTIPVTRRQILGDSLSEGRNADDVHQLSLDRFRKAAGKLVRREGLTPASE